MFGMFTIAKKSYANVEPNANLENNQHIKLVELFEPNSSLCVTLIHGNQHAPSIAASIRKQNGFDGFSLKPSVETKAQLLRAANRPKQ